MPGAGFNTVSAQIQQLFNSQDSLIMSLYLRVFHNFNEF